MVRGATCTDWSPICWLDAHPGLAGWLQAIGGLILIAFSVWQVSHIARQQRDDRERDRRQFFEMVRECVMQTSAEFGIVRVNLDNGSHGGVAFHAAEVEHDGYRMLTHLAAIPLERWPSVWLFSAVQSLVAAMKAASGVAALFKDRSDPMLLGMDKATLLGLNLDSIDSKAKEIQRYIARKVET